MMKVKKDSKSTKKSKKHLDNLGKAKEPQLSLYTPQVALDFLKEVKERDFYTVLADPPWRFQNRTGKMAPEHKRLNRYPTLTLEDIKAIPVKDVIGKQAHLYLWVPNALLLEGIEVLKAWGFEYKSNLIWHKVRKDGGPDGRGVGFYFRNTTEMILFGIKGKNVRTLAPGRSQVNIIRTMKQEHSRKPDEVYDLIERCSPPKRLELFARSTRKGWKTFGNQADDYEIGWKTYKNNSRKQKLEMEEA